ncbi:phytanoyl-CoA dioxygenase family protein [Botrimarina hoheduenensis]|uniref:Phytanoyl-CoA dioxygenase (PhyH) n=1 Tax=Botrimarina hoheduenensis TaxID=2528000 RepID=A0A5C5VUM4_9BACT|nr:phytanoyl-CoA dioxygenase family protein [Botrimarina hoheduenensis]TWT41625.1 Phytanoyl-CoA dioxygenase (PhyH) [Botrimarina hoheduenensis]
MNMHPKIRPLWQRIPLCGALGGLWAYKTLRLPHAVLPRDIKAIVRNWDPRMFSKLIGSGLTKAYIDQPCEFRIPAKIESKAVVAPEHRMSQDQLNSFYKRGFAGPFDVFQPEEMQDFKKDLLAIEGTKSSTYGFQTPRDRHFEMPRLWDYMKTPAVTDRIAQLLGEDLLCWRSQIFYKGPGSPSIQWHQASTFMVEDYQDPALFPRDRNDLFQITAWIAVDESTTENGCLRFAAGTHNRIRTISFGGNEGFYNASFSLDFEESEAEIVEVPCRAGQMILFTERCIHGSAANTTDRHRLAFNIRAIPTDVAVYPGKKFYRSVYNGGKYYLDNWGVAQLRGEDQHRLSRTIDPAVSQRGVTPHSLRAAA